MSSDEGGRSDERLSIWSVPFAWKIWFLALFTLQSLFGLWYLIYRTIEGSTGWSHVLFTVVTGMGTVGLGSAVVSFTILGLVEVVMLLHNEIRKVKEDIRRIRQERERIQQDSERIQQERERIQEDRLRAIEKRRAEVHRQWQDWIEANPAIKEAMESPGVTQPPSVVAEHDDNGEGRA